MTQVEQNEFGDGGYPGDATPHGDVDNIADDDGYGNDQYYTTLIQIVAGLRFSYPCYQQRAGVSEMTFGMTSGMKFVITVGQ